ncbi:MAG: Gfo/Idh/MocA family protein [Eubacteriales bacterium]
MKPFRFGIIGAGRIAVRFCDAVNRLENVEVTAVSSKDAERARDFAEKNGVPSFYGSYEQMLSREDIDAVYIATTHNFHHENILSCIEHGKHVLCEKCMVLTKAQAEDVFSRARQKGIFVMEAMWSRFLPSVQKVLEWVKDGRVGEIGLVSSCLGFVADKNTASRYNDPALAGGALYDMCVYAIEVVSYLVGKEISGVKSSMLYSDRGVDMVNNVTLEFEGCIANLQCSFLHSLSGETVLYGKKGCIKLPSFFSGTECYMYDNGGQLIESFSAEVDNGFTYEIEETVRCVRTGKLESEVMPHRDTIRCAEIFEICLGDKTH